MYDGRVMCENFGGYILFVIYTVEISKVRWYMSEEKERFHEVKRKVEEEAALTGTPLSDDLDLMAIVTGGVRRRRVYGAGSETVHLRAESSQAPSCKGLGLMGSCGADMLRRVEAAVSRVSDAFNEAAMGTDASTSSPSAPVADSEAPTLDSVVRSSFTPSPSIHAPSTDEALPLSSNPRTD
ncbi:hypothetical protein M9H77_16655 [Catharanthus roseus]|uniref:Uncharacterized protein n=1 Tax=Catharanthus roseus TaxID=4058 RepID=A0ACC0B2J2_CATRO|nr:hypothetical protein M9H77_16655 [Catharanthus roseus]